jgi:excisionase family DNA binding protein
MLLKTEAVALELSIAKKTVIAWIKQGKLKGIWLGRQWRVDSDDLAVFIEKRRT